MKTFPSAAAFKQSLERRLRLSSSTGVDFARRRQLLVFHRFLARIVEVFGEQVTLKGGLVVELRVERARTTKDVDLRVTGDPSALEGALQRVVGLETGDFLSFTVGLDRDHPDITNDGMAYEGRRYRVEGKLAGKPYGLPFGLDIAFADPIVGEPEVVQGEDFLQFVGIAPPMLRIYPLETHIAEKLHAYTLPRQTLNSRVKDLPDIALLAGVREIAGQLLSTALSQTFESRATHELPKSFPNPPEQWRAPYARMAQLDELQWKDLDTVTESVRRFLEPVLDRTHQSVWSPDRWQWGS